MARGHIDNEVYHDFNFTLNTLEDEGEIRKYVILVEYSACNVNTKKFF